MTISVLVLGTSNSLLGLGWVAGFRAASAHLTVTNRSVGGSPGIQFGCSLDTDFSKFDLVILESVPNDERPDYPPHMKAAIWRMLYEIASVIASQTTLVFLGFTNRVNLAYDSEEYTKRRQIARLCRVPFLDIRYLVNKYATYFLDQSTPIYEHPAHPARDFSRAVGFEFGCVITEIWAPQGRLGCPSLRAGENNFISLDPSEYAPPAKVQLRKSSSISSNIAVMLSGDSIEIKRRERLIGFYIDKVDTNGAVVFHQGRPRGRREFQFKSELARFELSFVQIGSGTFLDGLLIVDRQGQEEGSGRLSLGKMLFWNEPADKNLPDEAPIDHDDDLTRDVDQRLRSHQGIWRDSIAAFRRGKDLVLGLEHDKAIDEFCSALRDFPRHAEAVFDLAKAYHEAGQYVRAIETMTRFTMIEPQDTIGLRYLAAFYTRAGLFDDARSILLRALEIRPNDAPMMSELSKLEVRITNNLGIVHS